MRGLIAIAATALCLACVTAPAHAAVTVSSAQTQNMSCSSGICAPTAKNAVLNVGDLENLLASGNVTVTTTGSGVQANDIGVSAAFGWSDHSTLVLDAYHSIAVNKKVSVSGKSGLSVFTNDGGSDGVFSFGEKGRVKFARLSSPLAINGTAYTLVNSISSLASAIASNPSGAYALADNYDASQDGTYSDSPVATPLTGTVQGLGNTISNLSIDHAERGFGLFFVGMFSQVQSAGALENLRLSGISVSVVHNRFHTTGDIGGLVGNNAGNLFGDQAAGSITTGKCCYTVGGLAGTSGGANGMVTESSAKVRIKTGGGAGGLVGEAGGTISLSHADGAVKAQGGGGGLVGGIEGIITQSYATGTVTGGDGAVVGGFVGIDQDSDISNSYATGAVTGGLNAYVGGFSGDNSAAIEDSYSTGAVVGGTGSLIGGFSGTNGGFTDCYWDTTTSGTDQGTGIGNVSGLTGLTTQQLQSGLPAGFDSKLWTEDPNVNGGLPYLIANPPPKK